MAERANGILLDTSVVVAHLRGLINLQDLTAPGEPLFLPLVAVDICDCLPVGCNRR